ncbi:MAG: hypothetical protein MJ187_01255 [Alphaproteobacteria bacterium]|nr:hypothetical protein [Alphaproteobacteria bacterium]
MLFMMPIGTYAECVLETVTAKYQYDNANCVKECPTDILTNTRFGNFPEGFGSGCIQCDIGYYFDNDTGICQPAAKLEKTDLVWGQNKTKSDMAGMEFKQQCWTQTDITEYKKCLGITYPDLLTSKHTIIQPIIVTPEQPQPATNSQPEKTASETTDDVIPENLTAIEPCGVKKCETQTAKSACKRDWLCLNDKHEIIKEYCDWPDTSITCKQTYTAYQRCQDGYERSGSACIVPQNDTGNDPKSCVSKPDCPSTYEVWDDTQKKWYITNCTNQQVQGYGKINKTTGCREMYSKYSRNPASLSKLSGISSSCPKALGNLMTLNQGCTNVACPCEEFTNQNTCVIGGITYTCGGGIPFCGHSTKNEMAVKYGAGLYWGVVECK